MLCPPCRNWGLAAPAAQWPNYLRCVSIPACLPPIPSLRAAWPCRLWWVSAGPTQLPFMPQDLDAERRRLHPRPARRPLCVLSRARRGEGGSHMAVRGWGVVCILVSGIARRVLLLLLPLLTAGTKALWGSEPLRRCVGRATAGNEHWVEWLDHESLSTYDNRSVYTVSREQRCTLLCCGS